MATPLNDPWATLQPESPALAAMLAQDLSQEQLIKLFETYVSPGKVAFYKERGLDFVPGRREGVRIWDRAGHSYINCRSSGGVFNLGHRPPRIMQALRQALEVYDIGDHVLMSGPRAILAQRMASLYPGDLQYSFFGTAGAEANDVALKLARGYTGRMGVVSARGGYHGVSGLPVQAGDEDYIVGPRDPNFRQAPFGDAAAFEQLIDQSTAAVILETIPATGGFPIPPDDFFPRVRAACDKQGAVLVIDEVQTGLGRTGRLWAFEEWGIVPDVVVLGKGPSGAYYPMSVATWRKPLDRFFQERPFVHPSSFAGADLACVVFMAVLDEVTSAGFMEHVSAMGERMEEGLQAIQRRHPGWLREVRGRGLLFGIEGPSAGAGFDLAKACVKRGVLAIGSFNRPSTMQCLPPLIIKPEEVDEVLAVIGAAVDELAA